MTHDSPDAQKKRLRRILYIGSFALFSVLGVYLLLSLRTLILPTIIGALSAYICTPLLTFLKRKGLPRAVGIILLFGVFTLTVILLVRQVKAILPDEKGKLELRVRTRYKLNQKYQDFMGIDTASGRGNFLYNLVGGELNPVINNLNRLLMFNDEERALFEKYLEGRNGRPPVAEKFREYYAKNLEYNRKLPAKKAGGPGAEKGPESSALSNILNVLSLWIIAPFVFLFLLIDNGQIKKSFINLIPNKYFEVALTVLDNVDAAIGNYLRGTALECSLVGLTFILVLAVVGVEFRWALLIGIVAGATNAIPFLGPAIGFIVGAGYALMVEEVNSILPFMNEGNLILGVLAVVVIAQVLDNAVFQPVVLGGAVNLHPLVVVIGVMGGSILFGFVGMLFAVPAIVVFKVIFTTVFRELRDYYLI
jgi:predicted PurR-regulated permease PerM